MKAKNFIFAIATLGFLVTSCSPQSIDEDTTPENIRAIDKGEIIVPTHG